MPIAEEEKHSYTDIGRKQNYFNDDNLLAVCSGVLVKDIITESDSWIRVWLDRCVLSEMEA